MHTKRESRPSGTEVGELAESAPGFEELAAALSSIVARAVEERWPGWRREDTETITAAAREIRTIPEALSAGMKEAFTMGRRYGQGEEELAELNSEIGVLSRSLARQAWGGGRSGLA